MTKQEEKIKNLEDRLTKIEQFLGSFRPYAAVLDPDEMLENAPADEEPLTEEELQAIEETRKDLKAGKTISHEKFWGKYDLQD